MEQEQIIYVFDGVVKKIKHVKTVNATSDDIEESTVTLVNKMADKIVVTGPRDVIEEHFPTKMGVRIEFHNNGQTTLLTSKKGKKAE